MRRPLVEECERLTVRDVQMAIPAGATAVTLDIGRQEIGVIGRCSNVGVGYRYFFLCPACGRYAEVLYTRDFSPFLCRVCQGLVYASSMKTTAPLPVDS